MIRIVTGIGLTNLKNSLFKYPISELKIETAKYPAMKYPMFFSADLNYATV